MRWPTKKLGEICEIKKGKKPTLYKEQKSGVLPYLVAETLRGNDEKHFASVSDKNSVLVEKGEIIIICDGSNSGDVFLGHGGILASTMGKIIHSKEIDTKYLYLFLKQNFKYLNTDKVGAATPHLNQDKFKSLKIPLPPLSEQKRIVEKIEKLFVKIDEVEKLRAQSLAAAAALLPSALHQIFNSKIKSQESKLQFKIQKLSEAAKITSGGTPSRDNPNFYNGNIAWLKSGELNDNQSIEDSEEHITEDALENSNAKVFPTGTVLLAMYGATAGKLGILKKPAATNQAIAGIQPDEKKLSNRFLFYFLLHFRNELIAQAWGGAQPNISQRIIKEIGIPLPPIAEQKKIVAYLDSLSEKAQRLQELQRQTAADLAVLKQSILHKAFNGELIKDS